MVTLIICSSYSNYIPFVLAHCIEIYKFNNVAMFEVWMAKAVDHDSIEQCSDASGTFSQMCQDVNCSQAGVSEHYFKFRLPVQILHLTTTSCFRHRRQPFWHHLSAAAYRISQPIRCTFFPEKCDLNLTRVLCVEGKHYFQTYKYPYPHRVKTTLKMILVAVMTIFWVSMVNKLYYVC